MDQLCFTDRCRGCLLGGAVGDALGAPVEFLEFPAILERFGPGGIRDFSPEYGRLGAITDDTQMTLFTAEGLLRASVRQANKGICHTPSVVHHAYLRWLKTQGAGSPQHAVDVGMDGWLINVPALWSARAPGTTCLAALRATERFGDPSTNGSKGCGGVMRAAPVGLVADPRGAFELGCEVAALTHGHPSGYLSAGFLAALIAEIVRGSTLHNAIALCKRALMARPQHSEVLNAVNDAESLVALPTSNVSDLGQGWVAEEALAIAVYCSLGASNFEEAVIKAVNHSGDSDSTGAIAGNICGALYGVDEIPLRWRDRLEMRDEITAVADDLTALVQNQLDETSEATWARYPGW